MAREIIYCFVNEILLDSRREYRYNYPKKKIIPHKIEGSRMPNKIVHSYCDDVLGEHDGVELAKMIKNRDVSTAEVVEAAIRRAEKVEPTLNAIELALYEKALKITPENQKGKLAGVPTFIKDNNDLSGTPTRQGSRASLGRVARQDGPFVSQFLATGVIPIGKSRLPEFGLNASTEFGNEPPTKNPWNTAYSAGGSSGGRLSQVARPNCVFVL